MMGEYNSNADYLNSFPPRLEDAGLEDTALSAEGIQEAFHRAAEVVRSDAGCVDNPGPSNGGWTDSVDIPGLDEELRLEKFVDASSGGLIQEGHDLVLQGVGEKREDQLVQGQESGSKMRKAAFVQGKREVGVLPGKGRVSSSSDNKTDDEP